MDDAYLDSVLSGNVDAFGYFVKTYKDMAFNISMSIVKDEHYAEEVTQDAFMKAFTALKTFNREATFKSWFYRIVVNESFLRLRKLKKAKILVSFEDENNRTLEDVSDYLPDNKTEKIQAVLSLLVPKEGLALQLFYLEELSINEIVAITGWTKANTKVILHRARKNVRKCWNNTR